MYILETDEETYSIIKDDSYHTIVNIRKDKISEKALKALKDLVSAANRGISNSQLDAIKIDIYECEKKISFESGLSRIMRIEMNVLRNDFEKLKMEVKG